MILSPLPILRQNLVHYSVGRTELCDLYDFLGVVSRHSKSALLSCSLGVCSWPKTGFPEFRIQEWASIISPHSHLFPRASSLIRTLFRIPAGSATPLLFLEPHFNHPNQQNIEFQTLSTPLRPTNSGRHAMSPLLIFTLHSVHSVRIEHRCWLPCHQGVALAMMHPTCREDAICDGFQLKKFVKF